MLSCESNTPTWVIPFGIASCVATVPRISHGVTRTRHAVPLRIRAKCSVDHPAQPRPSKAAVENAELGNTTAGNGVVRDEICKPEAGSKADAMENANVDDFVILEDVTLSYSGRKVLDGLNLRIRAGEGTAIIGPSGTGKSSALRLICGLELPDSGRVFLKGWRRTKRISEEFGPVRVSMVFQQAALFDSLTVCENVGFELFEHSKLPRERIVKLVEDALARVGLKDVMDKFPGQLSGGMRKRVSFARAVMYDPEDKSSMPDIILFDEPSSALDPTSSTRIENCIRALQEVCSTYIVVTHEINTIRRTADRVVFLHNGKVQWDGPVEDIDTTNNPFIRQFMTASLEGPLTEKDEFGHIEDEIMGEADI